MDALPEELWLQVLQIGIRRESLGHQEFCVLASVSRRFRRLCSFDSVWELLWKRDFACRDAAGAETSRLRRMSKAEKEAADWKAAYQIRYQSVKNAIKMSHMRAVLAVQSEIAGLQNDCNSLQRSIEAESSKLSALFLGLGNLKHARQAKVALQIWQPQSVRTRHELLIQQQPADTDSQRHLLEMEVRVCRNLISTYKRSLIHKRELIDMRVQRLEQLSRNPMEILKGSRNNASAGGRTLERKFDQGKQLASSS